MSRGSKIIHIPEKQKIIKEPRGRNEKGSWQEHLVPYQHATYWHTICYSCKTKTDKCQEDRKLFTYPKTKGPKHGIDSGLECALEVFEQPRRRRGSKETLYRIYQLLRKRMEFRLKLEENSVQNLPGME